MTGKSGQRRKKRLFGQRDHVRRYWPDYADRFVEAEFSVVVDGFGARTKPPKRTSTRSNGPREMDTSKNAVLTADLKGLLAIGQ